MLLPRRVIVILTVFAVGAVSLCGADTVVGIVVAGKPLESGPAPRAVNGVALGPLGACARLAGAEANWDAGTGTLTVTAPGRPRVVYTAGSGTAQVGEGRVAVAPPAQVRDGVLYGPVTPLLEALGYRVRWGEGRGFLLANAVVRAVHIHAGDRGARITVETTAPVQGTVGGLEDPPRSFVDLRGAELAAGVGATRYTYTGPLLRVRTGTPASNPPTVRVVADLAVDAPAEWEAVADRRGGNLVLGDGRSAMRPVVRNFARLTGMTTSQPRQQAGGEVFRATVNYPVATEWDVALRPPRVTLTFPEVEPAAPTRADLPMRGEFVDRVSVATTADPPETKLTLFLRELINFSVTPVPAGGAEVRFLRERLADKTVVLDPGHGGKDDGARGRVLKEKEVNLDVALRTARRLRELGTTVYLTRVDDRYVGLYDRPQIATRAGGDMFVSIHCNAMPQRNVGRGTETFYHFMESKALGLIMQDSLIRGLGRVNRGLKTARFVVIREATMPAVLVELMFLNCDTEEALLQQDSVRESAAASIVEGLRQFAEGTGTTSVSPERSAGLTRQRVANP